MQRKSLLYFSLSLSLLILSAYVSSGQTVQNSKLYNVRDFGAVGDGKNLDSNSINRAIDTASTSGGIVLFPPGIYSSVSIRLKSNVALWLEKGATILAADPREGNSYDLPEPNPFDQYQDFGHSHWHNSLIWGENLSNVFILGPGIIDGRGLVKSGAQSRTLEQNDALRGVKLGKPFGYPNPRDIVENGWANKAIALKNCSNVKIGDGLTIYRGGHFAILVTGVDGLIIDRLTIDTNRDGIDIDASKNVVIANTKVNSPFDDAIVLKSSLALGKPVVTSDVTIKNSLVSGYDVGTLISGTFGREGKNYNGSPNGRIKLGTESNGGFRNIKILSCEFEYSRGLAIEMVDGGVLENVVVDDIKLTDATNSPIFIRLGNRARGPKETMKVGALRNVEIRNVVATNADSRFASVISGIPGSSIENLTLANIKIQYKGGGTPKQATLEPQEKEDEYPEPSMFGLMPAYGFYIRHVSNIKMDGVSVSYVQEDARPAFILDDVADANFNKINAQHASGVPTFSLKNIRNFGLRQSQPIPDSFIKLGTLEKF